MGVADGGGSPAEKEEAMIYTNDDHILSVLKLPKPCKVEVETTDKYVLLRIGPRDWQWDRKTGAFIGAGTRVE